MAGDVDVGRPVGHDVFDQLEQTLGVPTPQWRDDLEADQGPGGLFQVLDDFHD